MLLLSAYWGSCGASWRANVKQKRHWWYFVHSDVLMYFFLTVKFFVVIFCICSVFYCNIYVNEQEIHEHDDVCFLIMLFFCYFVILPVCILVWPLRTPYSFPLSLLPYLCTISWAASPPPPPPFLEYDLQFSEPFWSDQDKKMVFWGVGQNP